MLKNEKWNLDKNPDEFITFTEHIRVEREINRNKLDGLINLLDNSKIEYTTVKKGLRLIIVRRKGYKIDFYPLSNRLYNRNNKIWTNNAFDWIYEKLRNGDL